MAPVLQSTCLVWPDYLMREILYLPPGYSIHVSVCMQSQRRHANERMVLMHAHVHAIGSFFPETSIRVHGIPVACRGFCQFQICSSFVRFWQLQKSYISVWYSCFRLCLVLVRVSQRCSLGANRCSECRHVLSSSFAVSRPLLGYRSQPTWLG
jgi:hypothetical protein